MCRGIVMSSNYVVKFVVILYISFAVILLRKSQKTDCLTLNAFLLSCDCLCTVLFIIEIVVLTCFLIQTEKQTD